MQQTDTSDATDPGFALSDRPSVGSRIGFDLLGALRRQFPILVVTTTVGLIAGVGYALQAIPTYTSTVSILIDAKKVGITATSPLEGSLTFESGAIDSQLQIMTSDKLAASVATRLGLQNDMGFLDPPPSFVQQVTRDANRYVRRLISSFVGSTPSPGLADYPEPLRVMVAATTLQNNFKVTRVARSYVFNLSYTAREAGRAQAIVGAFANAYLEDQLDSKFDSTRRATNWMEERIRDLRAQSLAADEAVQRFRADNNLVAANGRLLDEQSLLDATTQLTNARGALDVASAKYQTLKKIVDDKDINAGLTASVANPNVAQLRSKYLAAAKLQSEISARYGANHLAAEKARQDMAEYTKLIFAELANLLPGYESDVAIAQAQVASIQSTIDQMRTTSATNDSAMVKLRSLEQESTSLRALYSTFLQKAQELQQQQSFPVTDARIISDPSTPLQPSGPRIPLILAVACFLGGAMGFAIGAFREWRDRGFRTASQVRDELDLEFIANVPLLKDTSGSATTGEHSKAAAGDPAGGASRGVVASGVMRATLDQPFSQYAEAIRAMRLRVRLAFSKNGGVVIGMASMFANEGKSTVAKNLSSTLAAQGSKTLLIDGDLRNPTLTKQLLHHTSLGLSDVVAGDERLEDVIVYEGESGLAFLPAGSRRRGVTDLFGSSKMQDVIQALKSKFDVIIIDFPPVGALTDALDSSDFVDGNLLILHWGKTPRHMVKEFLENHPYFADRVLGVVLNMVDLKKLEKYGSYQGSYQYKKHANTYFDGKKA